VVTLLKPLIVVLNAMSNGVLRLFRVQPRDEVASTYTPDEVAGLIGESRQEGLLDADEEQLLSGALGFEELTVETVVLPRADLTVLPADATPEQIRAATARTGYSRFPVTGEGAELVGYLHVKDALGNRHGDAADRNAGRLARPLPTVAADDTLRTALGVMREQGAHLAAVPGPDGGVRGVVALEDVLERLVGQVEDTAGEARHS
jgi:CBS domain containing-hemolysin-like protein